MTASDESWDRPGASLAGLCDIMRRLLAPDGCPWDREQTLESLRPYLIEEAYEVLEALETGTPADHCEELGDLLMNVVFQAALREQDGEFGIDDVVRGISDKLIRRHPHVFADAHAESSEEVLTQWEEIKRRERAQKERGRAAAAVPRTLAGVPLALPALARAQQVSARAARVGFDWPEVQGCRDQPGSQARLRRRGGAARVHAALHRALRIRRGPPARARPHAVGVEPGRDGCAVGRGESHMMELATFLTLF